MSLKRLQLSPSSLALVKDSYFKSWLSLHTVQCYIVLPLSNQDLGKRWISQSQTYIFLLSQQHSLFQLRSWCSTIKTSIFKGVCKLSIKFCPRTKLTVEGYSVRNLFSFQRYDLKRNKTQVDFQSWHFRQLFLLLNQKGFVSQTTAFAVISS